MDIKIKVETLPLHFVILGGFLIIYAILHLATGQYIILSTVLFVVGVLMLTSHQRLLINTDEKMYGEYYWVLGMRFSNYTEQYEEITVIACTSGNYSQQYGKYNRRFINGIMYKGYIELKDQDKLFLGQNKSKHALMKKLSKISQQLEVAVEDQTNKEN